MQFWDVDSGKQLRAIETGVIHRGSSLYFNLDPKWKTMYSTRGSQKAEQFEREGKRWFRWKMEGDIRAWDLASGKLQQSWSHKPPSQIIQVLYSADYSRACVMGYPSGEYQGRPPLQSTFWNLITGERKSLPQEYQHVSVLSPDGNSLVASVQGEGVYTSAIKIFDLNKFNDKVTIPIEQQHATATAFQYTPDQSKLIGSVTQYPGKNQFNTFQVTLKCWDATTGKELGSLQVTEPKEHPGALTFLAGGQQAVTTFNTGSVRNLCFLDLNTLKITRQIKLRDAVPGHTMMAYPIILSPDGNWITIVTRVYPRQSNDALSPEDVEQPQVHLVNAQTGDLVETFHTPHAFTASCAFSPDGKLLATTGLGNVHVWDLSLAVKQGR